MRNRTAVIEHLILCRRCYFVLSETIAWLYGTYPEIEEDSP